MPGSPCRPIGSTAAGHSRAAFEVAPVCPALKPGARGARKAAPRASVRAAWHPGRSEIVDRALLVDEGVLLGG